VIAYAYRDTKFNLFFLIIATTELISIGLWSFFSLSAQSMWIPMHYLLILSIKKEFILQNKRWIIISLIPILFLNFLTTNVIQHYAIMFANFIILIFFVRFLIDDFLRTNKFNYFFVAMILFQLVSVLRFIPLIRGVEMGLNIYFASLIVQILIQISLVLLSKKYLETK
jgi:hypothetical protein